MIADGTDDISPAIFDSRSSCTRIGYEVQYAISDRCNMDIIRDEIADGGLNGEKLAGLCVDLIEDTLLVSQYLIWSLKRLMNS